MNSNYFPPIRPCVRAQGRHAAIAIVGRAVLFSRIAAGMCYLFAVVEAVVGAEPQEAIATRFRWRLASIVSLTELSFRHQKLFESCN